MKALRSLLCGGLAAVLALAPTTGAAKKEESLGDKLKKLFATPTPTPSKKKKSRTAKKTSPTPTPKSSASPKPKSSASPKAKSSATPKPTASPEETPRPTAAASERSEEAAEPSATPRRRASPKSSPKSSPLPTPRKKRSPTPAESTPPPTATPDESGETPSPLAEESPMASPTPKRSRAPVASISPNDIIGYDSYPENVRRLLGRALFLTTQNLGYKYGSADPSAGGMDCSGFIHYVLSQQGLKDVPRDSREQYIWVRKAGLFQAVVGRSEDTFELDDLQAGDLLFWTGTYAVQRDPAITHVMIYLGREKGTNRRVMVGSSDGRTYHDQSRSGVSVFDFKMPRPRKGEEEKPGPTFVGYGRIPDLR